MTSQNKKKMGRPKKDNPQNKRASTMLTESEHKSYEEYCEKKEITISQDLRDYILSIIKK